MKKINKILVSGIVVITCIVGLIGTFNNSPVNMDSFAKFVTSFAAIFGPFIVIIAAGGESKRLIQTKYGNGNTGIELSPPQEEKK